MGGKPLFPNGFGSIPPKEISKLSRLRESLSNNQNRTKIHPSNTHNTKRAQKNNCTPMVVKSIDNNIPFMNVEREEMVPLQVSTNLAEIVTKAVINKCAIIVLVWPCIPKRLFLPLIQSTLSLYSQHEEELRVVYWPAKLNTFASLKDICLDAAWLLEKSRMTEGITSYDKKLKRKERAEIRNKDMLFLRLNSLVANLDSTLSLAECINIFHFKQGIWSRSYGDFFQTVPKSETRPSAKKAIRDLAMLMQRPEDCRDSIFYLHHSLQWQDMEELLLDPIFSADLGTPFNLAFLDLRGRNRYRVLKWKSKTAKLFNLFQGSGEHAPIGFMAVTDSPLVFSSLQGMIEQWEFSEEIACKRFPVRFDAVADTDGADIGVPGSGVFPDRDAATVDETLCRRFSVQVTDRPTAAFVKRFLDLAHEISSFSQEASSALFEVAKTLSDISLLPGGQRAYARWVAERSENAPDVRTFAYWDRPGRGAAWKGAKLALGDLLEKGFLGQKHVQTTKLLEEADAHAATLLEETPAGSALSQILDKAVARQEGWDFDKLVIVTDVHSHFHAAKTLIDCYEGPGPDMQVMLPMEAAHSDLNELTGVVCLFTRHHSVRYLFMFRNLPGKCRVIIGHSLADRVVEILRTIEGVEGFGRFHPLARHLANQVSISVKGVPVFSKITTDWDDHIVGREVFEDTEKRHALASKETIIVGLDGCDSHMLSPRSQVYVLDEESSWGFRAKTAVELVEDDILLVLPNEVIEAIGEKMQKAREESLAKTFRSVLYYQECVRKKFSEILEETGGHVSYEDIRDEISRIAQPARHVSAAAVRYWFSCKDSRRTDSIMKLVPCAPGTWDHFRAFAEYLEMADSTATKLYPDIVDFREMKRRDGLNLRQEALRILADEHACLINRTYPRELIEYVRSQACSHSYRVNLLAGLGGEGDIVLLGRKKNK